MPDHARELRKVIEGHSDLWRSLRERFVIVTASRGAEGAFHRAEDVAAEAARLAEADCGADTLEALCRALEQKSPANPCVIDVLQAAGLMREQRMSASEAIMRSRVRYQGTDGVRGKVAADDPTESALAKLTRPGEFTPGLCELLCAGVMLARKDAQPPTVVVAEDGRDAFGRREYATAAIRAFTRFGCRVLDLGIAPTPLAPVAAAKLGADVAVVVTASHNPADQNGIKFFLRGRKPLPESGDYPLSAFTSLAALEGLPDERASATAKRVDAKGLVRDYTSAALAREDVEALRHAGLIIDVAHGAFAPFAEELLQGLGLRAEVINDDMTGDNINRDSGVAYIEGKERIAAAELDGEIALVGRVRSLARESDERVFGIALDADGDRALLVVHDGDTDEVRIIDGDRMAFLITRLARKTGDVKGCVFAGTVESDLATFDAVAALGIETVLTPVGDKWLSARPALADRLLVGEESSGHLVWPVDVPMGTSMATIVTGNGLLTGLRAAAAVLRLELTPAEAAEPFPPGVVRTFYTYFVDRARFHRGSLVWKEDVRIIGEELAKLKDSGAMPAACKLRQIDFDDDPDMLYLNIEESGRVVGAVFARNSGTENKTATYARGRAEFETQLVGIAREVNEHHIRSMKDTSLGGARAAGAIAAALSAKGALSVDEARRIADEHGIGSDAGFVGLLFALTREGKAKRVGDEIRSAETQS